MNSFEVTISQEIKNMKRIKSLLRLGGKKTYDLRFSKSDNQWQVYREGSLMYLGSKEACQVFVSNMEV